MLSGGWHGYMNLLFCGLLLYPSGWLSVRTVLLLLASASEISTPNSSVTDASAACWDTGIMVESFIHFRISFLPVLTSAARASTGVIILRYNNVSAKQSGSGESG